MAVDHEAEIKAAIQKSPDEQLANMRKAVENIELIAKVFGTKAGSPIPLGGHINVVGDAEYRDAALDTIANMAKDALRGIQS